MRITLSEMIIAKPWVSGMMILIMSVMRMLLTGTLIPWFMIMGILSIAIMMGRS